jgi:hypothetical protein
MLCFGSCCIQVLSIALVNNGEQTRKIMQQQLAVQCVVNLQPQNGTPFLASTMADAIFPAPACNCSFDQRENEIRLYEGGFRSVQKPGGSSDVVNSEIGLEAGVSQLRHVCLVFIEHRAVFSTTHSCAARVPDAHTHVGTPDFLHHI